MTTPKTEEPKPNPVTEPTPTPASDSTPDPDKTFTQAEVNRFVGQRVIEERAKTPDYEDLKAKASKFDEAEAAKLSTEERLTAEVATANLATTAAGQKVTDMAITAEIKVKAGQMGLQNPDDALALVARAGISYSAESGVEGVTEALEALVAAKPYLKGAVPGAPNLNPNGGTPTPVVVGLTDDERLMAHRLFRTKSHAEAEAEYALGKR
jgi:hypothetical protein